MSRAHAATMNGVSGVSGAPEAIRAALGLAIAIALLVVAVFSFAAHADGQAAADEIAQLGD